MGKEFDPGEVWDALKDDVRCESTFKELMRTVAILVEACDEAVDVLADTALEEGDEGFAAEVAEHREAFVDRLATVALKESLRQWKEARAKAAA